MIIDSHQHFWKYDSIEDEWINNEMVKIKRDFLPADAENILLQNNVTGCIAVQAHQTEVETIFLHDLAIENDFIKGVVGWVDFQADDVSERVGVLSALKKLKGFRHMVQSEKDPDFLKRNDFISGIKQLKKHHFVYEILIRHQQLPETVQFAKNFPDQILVLDHIAKPDIKSGIFTEWDKNIRMLADQENICCKLSGLVTEADWQSWKPSHFAPYFDTVFECFGTERIMFGSDWPVCLLAAEYHQALLLVTDYLSSFSENEKSKVMGKNASRIYNI